MFFTGVTEQGSPEKANEDWAAATADLIVVLDGATVRTDTGCHHGVSWYVRKLGAAIIAGSASRSRSLVDVLGEAIQDVANLHPECDLQHPGTPSAGVAVVRAEGGKLRYLVLGDVTLVLDTSSGIKEVSDHRVSQVAQDERREADRFLIGDPDKAEAMVRMKHLELAARNTEGGYWIAAADPAAADKALVGEIDAAQVRRFTVLSDGAARAVDMFGIYDWNGALDLLASAGPAELVRQIRLAETDDPSGAKFPRNKRSDDATAIYVVPLFDRLQEGTPVPVEETGTKTSSGAFDPTSLLSDLGLMGAEPRNPDWKPEPRSGERPLDRRPSVPMTERERQEARTFDPTSLLSGPLMGAEPRNPDWKPELCRSHPDWQPPA